MIANPHAQNKVFFVCPFCQLEQEIRKQFGNVYFFTAPAAIFNFNDNRVTSEISSFLVKEMISDIYLVCNLECNFINSVLSGKIDNGLKWETIIDSLACKYDRPSSLAEKIIWKQVDDIKNCNSLCRILSDQGIKLHGLITSKRGRWHTKKYYFFKIPTLSYP